MTYYASENETSTWGSNATEPRVCFDTNCSLPYGAICDTCNFDIELKKLACLEAPEDPTEKWVQSILGITEEHLRAMKTDPNAPIFIGGADEIDAYTREEAAIPGTSKIADEIHQTRSLSRTIDVEVPSDFSPGIVESQYARSGLFEASISDLLDRTLKGPFGGDDFFSGGAEEEDHDDSLCPLCLLPLGDPTLQHLLNCKYAHEEEQRLRHAEKQWHN